MANFDLFESFVPVGVDRGIPSTRHAVSPVEPLPCSLISMA